jgi:hypothetical protein
VEVGLAEDALVEEIEQVGVDVGLTASMRSRKEKATQVAAHSPQHALA